MNGNRIKSATCSSVSSRFETAEKVSASNPSLFSKVDMLENLLANMKAAVSQQESSLNRMRSEVKLEAKADESNVLPAIHSLEDRLSALIGDVKSVYADLCSNNNKLESLVGI